VRADGPTIVVDIHHVPVLPTMHIVCVIIKSRLQRFSLMGKTAKSDFVGGRASHHPWGEPAVAIGIAYPHIEKPQDQPARLERLPRIRVAQIVMDYLAHGWSPDEMCRQHPYLTLAEAHAAMAFYFDHQAEIDREIEVELEHVEQDQAKGQQSPMLNRLRLRRRA
jgi:Protein of unknown function (DUF433)